MTGNSVVLLMVDAAELLREPDRVDGAGAGTWDMRRFWALRLSNSSTNSLFVVLVVPVQKYMSVSSRLRLIAKGKQRKSKN
jgi:hypothetical protein